MAINTNIFQDISLTVEGLNGFCYQTSPNFVMVLTRIDSCSLVKKSSAKLLSVNFYRIAIDEVCHDVILSEQLDGFQCTPVANLPPGFLDITECQVQYNNVSYLSSDYFNVTLIDNYFNNYRSYVLIWEK